MNPSEIKNTIIANPDYPKLSKKKDLKPDLDNLVFWEAQQLYDLAIRLNKTISALNKRDPIPNEQPLCQVKESDLHSFMDQLLSANDAAKKSIVRDRDCLFDYFAREISRIKIKDRACLKILSLACFSLYFTIYLHDRLTNQHKVRFIQVEQVVRNISHEAIGYWEYHLEIMMRNKKISEVMTGKGRDNEVAIKEILNRLNIRTLAGFRLDKQQRKEFLILAEKATMDKKFQQPLSDKRIMDIARKILKTLTA